MGLSAPKICIADDEPRGRQILHDLLAPEGYELFHAVDGEDAVARILAEQPDLVLLDVMMPRLNGFDVCRRVRADARMREVPVLLLTALDDRASRLQGLEAGADDFISKPLDAVELRTRIRTIVRLNRFRTLYGERERFASALALSPDALAITAPEGAVHFANDRLAKLIDPARCRSAITGNFFDAFAPEHSDRLRRGAAAVLAGRGPLPVIEAELAAPQRSATVVEITAGLLPWKEGPALQFIIRDVTDKKLLEVQLQHSHRIEVLGQLAGGIVHDVNNLLTAILSSSQLAQLEANGAVAAHLRTIESTAMRGANLLRQLLMFARGSDEGRQEVLPGGILAEVAGVIREMVDERFKVELSVDEDSPLITADPNQLHQVVMNLCVNARDAMPAGGTLTLGSRRRTLTVEAAAQLGREARAGEYVVLGVADTGTGMPPQVRAKLFDPFFTTKPPGKGTGLGLATVLRLVRRHGGFVHVETAVGAGSRFDCYLPLQPATGAAG